MNTRRWVGLLSLAGALAVHDPRAGQAQCCLNDLFGGMQSCFRKAPQAYAIAPVAPMAAPVAAPLMAPMAAPMAAPPSPVMVPVQQVSYVPETTYRTQYRCVPVTSYKPSSEIDPCTGCPRECMEQVTNYVQQAVNVPYTQYRAVYSTKYVQMQPGQSQQGYAQPAYGQPTYGQPASAAPVQFAPATTVAPGPAGAASSPFSAPIQTTPQAWGAAGADIPQQIVNGQTSIAAPMLPQGTATSAPPTYQPQIVPQSGSFAAPLQGAPALQPTTPPGLSPTPALRPIQEAPRTPATGQTGAAATGAGGATPPAIQPPPAAGPALPQSPAAPAAAAASPASAPALQPRLVPIPLAPAVGSSTGIPTVPGPGPRTTTGAFPRLVEPTIHTTSWQPAVQPRGAYPTAALPSRPQQ
ncbi:MAG: hypothetical protein DWH79_05600 [Planctomycetota bacterium]|nr:MAG: hypothetical protein DWH79_05600 [Planctomycetota bacterium]